MGPFAASDPDLQNLVVEQAPDALVLCTPDDVVTFWSPGAEATFGYSAGEALGRTLAELVVPPDRREAERQHRDGAQRGDALARSVLRRHRDGRLLYVDCTTRAVRRDDGTLRGFVSCTRDVTALTIERDARLIEDRYRDLLEWVPDAIVIANEIGRIVLFNNQSETMFGYTRAEMIGQPIEALLPQRHGQAHVGHRLRYQHKPQVRRMGAGLELYALRKDGSEFPVEISLSPLGGAGDGRFVVSAIRDISLQKQAARELHEKNEALQVASQAKDRFLATMSHELRTPLNAILGFSGILLMKLPGPLNAEQERQLGIVKSSGEHLLALINDLLDLAKIQSGTFQLSLEPIDIGALLTEVRSTLQPLADKKGLLLSLLLPAAPLQRALDRRALTQVLINLANNAIKFTATGSVALELAPGPRGPEISVVDTGVGIAEADQPKLFGSFTQVGDPRRRPEGTGLGLHLSARLAALMGGRIELQSVPGVGSRFTLCLDDD